VRYEWTSGYKRAAQALSVGRLAGRGLKPEAARRCTSDMDAHAREHQEALHDALRVLDALGGGSR
jgi:hypothetical protein